MTLPPSPVLVIGCGLIGTSVALGLVSHGVQVLLEDSSAQHLDEAISHGAGSALSPEDRPRFVVVAVPPSSAGTVVLEALRRWPEALVTDVTSVKSRIQDAIARGGRPGVDQADAGRYAGGHPMAGSERSGPGAANPRLFEGRPWAVTPTATTQPAALDAVVDLARQLGAVPIIMNAGAHDRAVAVVSHVPQVMATLTAARLNDAADNHLALSGAGLRDVTRIAGSDMALWRQILGDNAADVRSVLAEVRADLDRVIGALESGDDAQLDVVLGEVLEAGRRGTELIPGKHGSAPSRLDIVFVQVEDRAGELPRLMTDTGDSGFNIEDLRLDHDLGRPVGLAEISVATGLGETLVEALTSRGWTAYR